MPPLNTFYLMHDCDGTATLYKLETNLGLQRVLYAIPVEDQAGEEDSDWPEIKAALGIDYEPEQGETLYLVPGCDIITATVIVDGDGQ